MSRTLEEEAHGAGGVRLSGGQERERAVAVFLIGCIDRQGYLRTPLSEVARATQVSEEEAAAVLRVLQGFEPRASARGSRGVPAPAGWRAARLIYEGLVARLIAII